MKILQILKFGLICIMVAMVNDKYLLMVMGFLKKLFHEIYRLALIILHILWQLGRLICTTT